ncbi:hypothetical protein RZS08_62000, partial [Arthrospira platensis SPKY1]|nr:hypothetical protein [Arthrospira platensis SPKY1]
DLVPADPARAAAYLETALEAGNTTVRTRLAGLYLDPEHGLGPGRDAAAGRRLLEDAVAEGDPDAAFALARLLDADPTRARALYTVAAEAGITAAQKALGDELRRGAGGPTDPARAA